MANAGLDPRNSDMTKACSLGNEHILYSKSLQNPLFQVLIPVR